MSNTTYPGTRLLNDDGSASMATALMSSHHAFRRDIALFAQALRHLDPSRVDALREEWTQFRNALHGHHTVEDTHMFPGMKAEHPSLAAVLEALDADHRRIDPLLAKGDHLFADLPASAPAALAVVTELASLLAAHLAPEEIHITPLLRGAKAFPAPATEAEAAMYAQGFAWAGHGIAPEVLAALNAMLPPILTDKLPAARAAFAERCRRVWGSAETGASQTSVPDWLLGRPASS